MSNYFKIMLNASLAYSKNNIKSENEIIEEFLGFNAAPKVVPNPTPQIPRPMTQPMPQPMPQPMMPTYSPPMYHPIQPMYNMPYPYFGMNNIKQQKNNNNKSNDDDDDSFLKMLLTAGVLGGGGLAAYHYGPKLFKNSLSDKVGAAIDNAPNGVKALRNIMADLGYANVPNNEEVPMTSGGLPLSKSQQERMAQENRKNNNDAFINRASDAATIVPSGPLRDALVKVAGIFGGWTRDQRNAILDRANTSSEFGKSTKPSKSTKSKPTASTGKKKK